MNWLAEITPSVPQPSWEARELSTTWVAISQRAETLAQGIGHGPDPDIRKTLARRLLEADDVNTLKVQTERDAHLQRVIASLWMEDARLAATSLRKATLAAVFGEHRVTRMTARSLVAILIRDFSRLEQWEPGLFSYFTQLVKWAASNVRLSPRTQRNLILTVQTHPEWLLETTAPDTVARHLLESGIELNNFLSAIGARGFPGGTYADAVRQALFLNKLSEVDPATEDPIHEEVRKEAVYQAPTAEGGYFGHRLLKVLCSPQSAPGTMWLDTILYIAGDPRLSYTPKWTTWWSGVDPTVRAKVQQWLSSEDLWLFLATVEEFGLESSREDLQRMFSARKTFLEGLLTLGLVKETRLFMGSEAKAHLRKRLDKHLLSDITSLSGSSAKATSVIYVDCGEFHLVEGSHNFKLWVYNGQPAASLTNRTKRPFALEGFRFDVPQEFLKAHRIPASGISRELEKSRRHVAIWHHRSWQQKALESLEQFGIHLPAEHLMDEESYAEYRRRSGPRRPRWN
jgi:hypothetical protein